MYSSSFSYSLGTVNIQVGLAHFSVSIIEPCIASGLAQYVVVPSIIANISPMISPAIWDKGRCETILSKLVLDMWWLI